MSRAWMIRAGEGGCLIDDFIMGHIGVGWLNNIDITSTNSLDEIMQLFQASSPCKCLKSRHVQSMMLHKFRSIIQKGDNVITYDTKSRDYFFGTVTGDYRYEANTDKNYSHIRAVKWNFRFNRDELSQKSKNSLRSGLTLFLVKNSVLEEIQSDFFKKNDFLGKV